ncbi:MAG: lysophospholipid acyltransferase family protein [Anaerolineae bacterium]
MPRLDKTYLAYYLYRLGGGVVPRLPARLGYALCGLAAALAWQFGREARNQVQQNLRHVLGNGCDAADLARLSKATFRYLTYNYFDLFRLPHLSDEEVQRMVRVEGWEHIEAALAEGRGLVMTSAHFGNIEIVLYALLLRGLSITIPVERVEPPELFDYISGLRMSKGLRLIPIDGPLLEMYRVLKRGQIVGVAGDRDITNSGATARFFGAPARLPDGHLRLALRTGAPLVLGFSQRLPDFTYQARFWPPYHLPTAGDQDERLAAGMRYIVQALETAIRAAPEQWVMTAPIWVED